MTIKVLPNEILKRVKGKVYLGGEELSGQELENLKAEVRTFKEFRLHSVFFETVKQYAIEHVLADTTVGTKESELMKILFAKAMVQNLNHLAGIENTIEQL